MHIVDTRTQEFILGNPTLGENPTTFLIEEFNPRYYQYITITRSEYHTEKVLPKSSTSKS
jgi:hypothetical protein